MMERSEKETQILANVADLKEGYFYWETSQLSDFRRLCRRIGGEKKLIEVNRIKNQDGKVEVWSCRIPSKFYSPSTFGIKSASRVEAARKRDNFVMKKHPLSLHNDNDTSWMKNQPSDPTLTKKTPSLSQEEKDLPPWMK